MPKPEIRPLQEDELRQKVIDQMCSPALKFLCVTWREPDANTRQVSNMTSTLETRGEVIQMVGRVLALAIRDLAENEPTDAESVQVLDAIGEANRACGLLGRALAETHKSRRGQ